MTIEARFFSERPEDPRQGDGYYDEDTGDLTIYDKGAWKTFVDDVITYPTRRSDGALLYARVGKGPWRLHMVPLSIRYRKEGEP